MKDAAFHSEQEVYLESTDTDKMYMKKKDRVIENLTIFQRGRSGWRFRSIVSLNVFTAEYKPLKGSSYIPLHSCLASKKAIINMQNEDEECFKWSITRALNSKEIPTLEELRQLAKERGLKRYSKLNKAKLLEQLEIKVVLNQHRIDKKNCKNKRRNLIEKVLTSPLAGKISINLKRITRRFP